MTELLNGIVPIVVIAAFLFGIRLMNSPRTAVAGNLVGSLTMFAAVVYTVVSQGIVTSGVLWASIAIGGVVGYWLAVKAAMIRMPQFVALLNGLGGGASFLTALAYIGGTDNITAVDSLVCGLAVIMGGATFSGSLIAAAKLDGRISQKPFVMRGHAFYGYAALIVMALSLVLLTVRIDGIGAVSGLTLAAALMYGVLFAIRIGGADMPVAISLLNSLSGVAASISGFAVHNSVLVAVGAIVGAAGLILTRIMCRSMNRTLFDVIMGRTTIAGIAVPVSIASGDYSVVSDDSDNMRNSNEISDDDALRAASKVVIVPGYGMALAQAQFAVKNLYDILVGMGKDVQFAIHPVAGRMPGHMNVLLAEVDIPYDRLVEMDIVNPAFSAVDVVVIIGANDVVNPSAATTVGTPISGMPILNVTVAGRIIVCNLDTKPGYAGVDNPLYRMKKVSLRIGDAKTTVGELAASLKK